MTVTIETFKEISETLGFGELAIHPEDIDQKYPQYHFVKCPQTVGREDKQYATITFEEYLSKHCPDCIENLFLLNHDGLTYSGWEILELKAELEQMARGELVQKVQGFKERMKLLLAYAYFKDLKFDEKTKSLTTHESRTFALRRVLKWERPKEFVTVEKQLVDLILSEHKDEILEMMFTKLTGVKSPEGFDLMEGSEHYLEGVRKFKEAALADTRTFLVPCPFFSEFEAFEYSTRDNLLALTPGLFLAHQTLSGYQAGDLLLVPGIAAQYVKRMGKFPVFEVKENALKVQEIATTIYKELEGPVEEKFMKACQAAAEL